MTCPTPRPKPPRSNPGLVTLAEVAVHHGVGLTALRHALKAQDFDWHAASDRWVVPRNSPQHVDMDRVAAGLVAERPADD